MMMIDHVFYSTHVDDAGLAWSGLVWSGLVWSGWPCNINSLLLSMNIIDVDDGKYMTICIHSFIPTFDDKQVT